MGLSETILAAMIGAIATVATALFQLLTAFRAKGRTDIKPKRSTTLRSVLAVMALMAASAAGGYLYSQFLQERQGEDLRAMRRELRELRDLTAARVLERREGRFEAADVAAPDPPALADPAVALAPIELEPQAGIAESIAFVPACRAPEGAHAGCEEIQAQRIALCGTVPLHANVNGVQLFAQPDAVQNPWEQHAVAWETDIGGARFSGRTFEYVQGPHARAVCVNFLQWSSQHPYIARLLIEYSGSGLHDPPPGLDGTAHVAQSGAHSATATMAQPATPGHREAVSPASFSAPAAALQ